MTTVELVQRLHKKIVVFDGAYGCGFNHGIIYIDQRIIYILHNDSRLRGSSPYEEEWMELGLSYSFYIDYDSFFSYIKLGKIQII